MNTFNFQVVYQSKKSRARVGKINTPHGTIETPNFVAVGTNGTLKALDIAAQKNIKIPLMFCNTYHLMVQPGVEIIKNAGGLHRFINHKGPLITDSGGFQVFSLAYGTVKDELKSKGQKKHSNAVIKINEEGVLFRSYRDGTPLLLTPESSIQAQKAIGADIIVSFDELPPYHIDEYALKKSLERTHRWEKRSLDEHLKNLNNQAIYAVIHGGIDPLLRKKSCTYLSSLAFDGYAIGGSLGKNRHEMIIMLNEMMQFLPPEKPNHLLGIGDLDSIAQAIPLGIDTFDSSHPTRCARHGLLFTKQGTIKIGHASLRDSLQAIDPTCSCSTCTEYSAGYVHHLFKAHEITGLILATIHNVHFMINLMQDYRRKILDGEL